MSLSAPERQVRVRAAVDALMSQHRIPLFSDSPNSDPRHRVSARDDAATRNLLSRHVAWGVELIAWAAAGLLETFAIVRDWRTGLQDDIVAPFRARMTQLHRPAEAEQQANRQEAVLRKALELLPAVEDQRRRDIGYAEEEARMACLEAVYGAFPQQFSSTLSAARTGVPSKGRTNRGGAEETEKQKEGRSTGEEKGRRTGGTSEVHGRHPGGGSTLKIATGAKPKGNQEHLQKLMTRMKMKLKADTYRPPRKQTPQPQHLQSSTSQPVHEEKLLRWKELNENQQISRIEHDDNDDESASSATDDDIKGRQASMAGSDGHKKTANDKTLNRNFSLPTTKNRGNRDIPPLRLQPSSAASTPRSSSVSPSTRLPSSGRKSNDYNDDTKKKPPRINFHFRDVSPPRSSADLRQGDSTTKRHAGTPTNPQQLVSRGGRLTNSNTRLPNYGEHDEAGYNTDGSDSLHELNYYEPSRSQHQPVLVIPNPDNRINGGDAVAARDVAGVATFYKNRYTHGVVNPRHSPPSADEQRLRGWNSPRAFGVSATNSKQHNPPPPFFSQSQSKHQKEKHEDATAAVTPTHLGIRPGHFSSPQRHYQRRNRNERDKLASSLLAIDTSAKSSRTASQQHSLMLSAGGADTPSADGHEPFHYPLPNSNPGYDDAISRMLGDNLLHSTSAKRLNNQKQHQVVVSPSPLLRGRGVPFDQKAKKTPVRRQQQQRHAGDELSPLSTMLFGSENRRNQNSHVKQFASAVGSSSSSSRTSSRDGGRNDRRATSSHSHVPQPHITNVRSNNKKTHRVLIPDALGHHLHINTRSSSAVSEALDLM